MTTASGLLEVAVEFFEQKMACGESPTFTECLHEALHVQESERYQKPASYKLAGKLGTWVRYGCQGERYLDVGWQGEPEYVVIRRARRVPSCGYRIRVFLEKLEQGSKSCGMNTNVYERS